MVARSAVWHEPTRRSQLDSAPWLWRLFMWLDRGLVRMVGTLEVSGTVPAELRGRPVLLAANHIGVFDAFVLTAACHRIGVAPKFMMAGGLLDAPVLGWAMRNSGHLRVDRGSANVVDAFGRAVSALRSGNSAVLVYPEGRISREPGLWPERGKTGVARLALAADVAVLPISQWGAHEAAYWGTEVVTGWPDLQPVATSFFRAILRRPTFRVRFGTPVDLSGLSASKPGDAVRARDRIMTAIATGLAPLRAREMDRPRFHDPTRPTDSRPSPWKPKTQDS
jgi:1-acyl-sn-glycerol-3-phosphate acyltransferase